MTPDENRRISKMAALLITHLKNDTPDIGWRAMAFLLASHTKDTREAWLEQMENTWDDYHEGKDEPI